MSRSIKFRAWHKGVNGWMDPDYIDANGICYDRECDGRCEEDDKYELTQFTGLLDKNGKEIYDGDIVKALKHNEDSFTNEIVWRGGALWFGNWNWIEFQNIFRGIEVIGNKYELPTP